MNSSEQDVLLIFIKNPEFGKVKTRLAKSVGPETACLVYEQLLEITRNVTSKVNCDRQLWYSEYIDNDDRWSEEHYRKKLQHGQNLGERMSNAFEQAFMEGYEHAVIIGSDCAALKKSHLVNAYSILQNHDVVIGPSQDGGYYLLGMNQYLPDLFENMEWSTPSVYDETIRRIKRMNLMYEAVEELNDIDTEKDLMESRLRVKGNEN
ncbi:TIGR04282 family arsenosugar biosynthesis glycosyltransferase [Fodinibius saliphilus]|uniref:TIGR04282 family arsenosugar biosynthesis glycosyltransferase n=1 Tax=Fodinibius saliphilus TaxID=1920650 RepID=UPI0011092B43|nr:TIGR04282 family arsenosugar biosynthesis glycosyltransferase [Fodinibius saliphilus]